MERTPSGTPTDRWARRDRGVAVRATVEARVGRICGGVADRRHAPAGTGPEARTGIAAYISAAGVVSAKEVDTSPAAGYELLGWTSLLADVVSDDREDRVGGPSTRDRRSRPLSSRV